MDSLVAELRSFFRFFFLGTDIIADLSEKLSSGSRAVQTDRLVRHRCTCEHSETQLFGSVHNTPLHPYYWAPESTCACRPGWAKQLRSTTATTLTVECSANGSLNTVTLGTSFRGFRDLPSLNRSSDLIECRPCNWQHCNQR